MNEEMAEDVPNPEHAVVDELLPWYVNKTLGAGERARVRRHLDECNACRENVSLLSRVDAVVRRPMATPILPHGRSERLLARIDRLEFGGRRHWEKPSMIAAASLTTVAATLLLLFPDRRAGMPEPPVYETVTSAPRQATMDYVLNLEFEPGIGQDDRQRVLRELDAGDIRRDDVSGAYQVNVRLGATSLEELERFTRGVESRPEVRSARIIALQLPLRGEPAREPR